MADRGSQGWSPEDRPGPGQVPSWTADMERGSVRPEPAAPGVSGNAPRKEDINRKPQFKDVKGYNAHKTKGVERRNAAN